MDFSVVFDGIGSSIVEAVIGAVLGALISGPIGYKAGANSVKKTQKAGDGAIQYQAESIVINDK